MTTTWTRDGAINLFDVFLATKPKQFTANDVRRFAIHMGFPEPDDARAWGPIIRLAATDGRIVTVAMGRAHRKEAHARPVRIWSLAPVKRKSWKFW